ncbi:heptaprenylglyceryl phosphate synthase [Aquibacillus salsiterrae]|uniref:Heptaprenylglyceryl phosphate synthase n=1 Tax=Aquibacillus salsiterrae TaxID=2950439 RepID=A0A9X3WF18_9BACI|nr:heptaprenylglyceryl phosphate synthase [Aquibacillus salsiterrae]MDC3417498.1 heptaprenylglyceryl phosphate synthase [Aquibacillus salsiterrae]
MYNMTEWKHIFKLDPDKEIDDKALELICESGTDALIVGGTDNVTIDGVVQLLSRIRRYTVPCILEVSNIESVTPGFDYYFVPMVLNSSEKKWMMDVQHQAVKQYGNVIDWEELFVEGYCILNDEAKAYQYTNCFMPEQEDVIAFAQMAEHMFHLPIFYIEYSGKYGDPSLVEQVKAQLSNTQLFYGGGITSTEKAKEMSAYADVIVVGNVIYDNLKEALKTVQAVKGNE